MISLDQTKNAHIKNGSENGLSPISSGRFPTTMDATIMGVMVEFGTKNVVLAPDS
jgi:hypothetical protein